MSNKTWVLPFAAPIAYYFLWRRVADITSRVLNRWAPKRRGEPVPNVLSFPPRAENEMIRE